MKQVITMLVDDTDGSDADETVRFALDGVSYEIDLTSEHAAELRVALAPFVGAGRKATAGQANGRVHRVSGRSTNTSASDRAFNRAVREWAKAGGKTVSERGRIPTELVAEYRAAQSHTPAVREAVEAVNPQGDGLEVMKVGELRALAAERGWSSLTRSSKQAILATLRANPDGPPATAQGKPAKAAEKPVRAAKAPDMSKYTPAQRRELNEQARAFARLHNVQVAARGRVPTEIMAAYDANDPSLLPQS